MITSFTRFIGGFKNPSYVTSCTLGIVSVNFTVGFFSGTDFVNQNSVVTTSFTGVFVGFD